VLKPLGIVYQPKIIRLFCNIQTVKMYPVSSNGSTLTPTLQMSRFRVLGMRKKTVPIQVSGGAIVFRWQSLEGFVSQWLSGEGGKKILRKN
jgi:hypothetical protein